MKMPSGLIIQDQKVINYLLVHQEKSDKSEFLRLAGYTLENWQLLKQDILKAVEESEVIELVLTKWGDRFKVKVIWQGPNERVIRVITVWQQDEGSESVRFVTLYPDKTEED